MQLLESAACRLRRPALDRALAAGADPLDDRFLSLRAGELTEPDGRHALAVELERVVDQARTPPRGPSARVPLNRREILDEEAAIRALATELETAEHVDPRGVALVRLLLRDGGSVLYAPSSEPLDMAIRTARDALKGRLRWTRSRS